MPDASLSAQNTVIVGVTGGGKTTFAISLMLNSSVACRFILDDENRIAPRLHLKPCWDLDECEEALSTRYVVFNPTKKYRMQEGDKHMLAPKRRAFADFCRWIFQVCSRGPGEKIIYLPEIWRFCSPDSIPPEFASLLQMGRELNTHVVVDTQRPELANPSVLGQCTELVCFTLLPSGQPDCPVKTVARLGGDAETVRRLPLGTFISYNRLPGGNSASGRLEPGWPPGKFLRR